MAKSKICTKCGIKKRLSCFAINHKAGWRRPDCRICTRKKDRAYHKRNAEIRNRKQREYYRNNVSASQEYHLKKKFGITLERYNGMHAAQKGLCAICVKPETASVKGKTRKLCVDHCHVSGVIRGLLCRDCNVALGKLRDNPDNLRRAVEYLEFNFTPDADLFEFSEDDAI